MEPLPPVVRASSPGLRPTAMVAGRYALGVELGRGGMGVVYAARDTALGREVAVKLLRRGCDDARMLARLRREARAAAAVNHPNTVPAYDVGHDDEFGAFLVMERVRGVGLHQLPLPMAPAHVVELARQVCDALAATHASGIVHRDLKRQNLMLEPRGAGFRVRVMDFGVARSTGCGDTITVDGAFVGTARYAAPEQAEGQPIDRRTDLYALGVILYELLSGELPFDAPSDAALLYMHVHRPAPSLHARAPGVPAALASLVHRCLAKLPVDRPQDAVEVATCLADIAATLEQAPPLLLTRDATDALAETAAGDGLSSQIELPRGSGPRYVAPGTTSTGRALPMAPRDRPPSAQQPFGVARWAAAALAVALLGVIGSVGLGAAQPDIGQASTSELVEPFERPQTGGPAAEQQYTATAPTDEMFPMAETSAAMTAAAIVASTLIADASNVARVMATTRNPPLRPSSTARAERRPDAAASLTSAERSINHATPPTELGGTGNGDRTRLRTELDALQVELNGTSHSETRRELRMIAAGLAE